MRFSPIIFTLTAAVLALPLFAAALDVPSLDEPEFADLEVNRCVKIPDSCYEGLRVFTLEISFSSATPSNGFYVAFGSDTGNDYLEFEEVSFRIGFDRGQWKFRPKGMVTTYTCTNNFSQTGTKSLKMVIKVTSDGQPRQVVFKDGTQPFTFPGLDLSGPETIPDYFKPPFADLKVTRRGYFASGPNDATSVSFDRSGIKLIVR